jgi:hypothetical protein
MITGAHSIIYSADVKADLIFFKEILKFPNVDAGHGWLIFGLPPSEMAIHPSTENGLQEFYLICDNIQEFIDEMIGYMIECSPVRNERWGNLTYITLPGGGKLGVYEPKHAWSNSTG